MSAQLAHELHPAVPADRVGGVIRMLVAEYTASNAAAALSFAGFIARDRARLSHALASSAL